MKRLYFLSATSIMLLFVSFSVDAQAFWNPLNSPFGGMVASLVTAPNGHMFAARGEPGIRYGGIFRSTDNGATWTESDLGIDNNINCVINALHVDPSGNLFFVTNHSIYRSTDDGAHWAAANTGMPPTYLLTMAVSPHGSIFVTSDSGVFRSTDAGAHWSYVIARPYAFSSSAIAIDTSGKIFLTRVLVTGDSLYSSVTDGASWSFVSIIPYTNTPDFMTINNAGDIFGTSAADHKIVRSIDHGLNWAVVDSAIPCEFIGPPFITTTGSVFVGLSGNAGSFGGVLRSADNGLSWSSTNTGFEGLPFAEANVFAQNAGGDVFAGLTEGLFRSTDNGAHWSPSQAGILLNSPGSVAVAGNGHLFVGTDYGQIFRSVDNGVSWVPVSNGIKDFPVPRVIIFGPGGGVFDDHLRPILAVAPNGHLFACVGIYVYRSVDEGDNWTKLDSFSTCTAITADAAGRLFACGDAYPLAGVYRSTDDGTHWTKVTPSSVDSLNLTSIAINDSGYVFAGGQIIDYATYSTVGGAVYRSTDNGDSWTLTGSEITPFPIDAVAPGTGNTIIAGADSNGIFRSADNGDHWTNITTLSGDQNVKAITRHPDGHLFAAIGTRSDTAGGNLLYSTDDGLTWSPLTSGLTSIGTNSVVSLTAGANGNIYAGMGYGKTGGLFSGFEAAPGGVKQISSNTEIVNIYPNPIQDELNIFYTGTINRLSVSNSVGQVVYASGPLTAKAGHTVQLSLSGFPAGDYYVQINGSEVRKFVKR